MVKYYSVNETGIPLPKLYELIFLIIAARDRLYAHSTDKLVHTTIFVNSCRELAVSIRRNPSFMVDPMSYFSFQLVFHDWRNKGLRMYYLVYGMVHLKDLLLIIGKSSPCSGGSGFSFSLSELSFII